MLGVLGSLYLLEASGLVIVMASYKNGNQPPLLLLTGRYSPFFFAGMLGVMLSCLSLAILYRNTFGEGVRRFWLTVATNVLSVLLLLMIGEVTVRLLSFRTPVGTQFRDTLLLPRSWNEVADRNRDLLQKAPSNTSYLLPDDLLGWTVGQDRRSTDGLYFSSAEGIRSSRPGVRFADQAHTYRIALVGDSYTFGLGVPYEETWGDRLEQEFGAQVQVLNFGVDGYGVDQAYLKFDRDVRPWHPDLAILGFINHDLYRSMTVYSFVSFPEWGLPFAKPRFVVNGGKLALLNTPLLSPQAILSIPSITDLPFIEDDRGYNPEHWEQRLYHLSYLLRFITTKFQRWPALAPHVSDEAVTVVNSEIIASFVRLAHADGSIPLVVYFPGRGDLRGDERRAKNAVLGTLDERGIGYYEDLTGCLRNSHVTDLFVEGSPHYSARGNATVAQCLRPVILQHLSATKR